MQTNVIILLILTAILWGTTPIMEKKGLENTSPIVGLAFRNLAIIICVIAAIFIMGKTKELISTPPKTMLLFALTGIIAGFLAMLTYFGALKLGATTKIIPISATYPLVTALLGILILGEQATLLRILGAGLIIGGVWLVKIG
ncbi:MAG TPA: EamA family transporter [Planctomycetota bacterium]|nr:EamA family transporter [Planctomycetota bacterium]